MSAPSQDQLVTDHLPIVADIVEGVRARLPQAAPADDLSAVGRTALVEAASDFAAKPTSSFARYAIPRVRSAVHTAAGAGVSAAGAGPSGAAAGPSAAGAGSVAQLRARPVQSGLAAALVDGAVAELLRRPGLQDKRSAAAARLEPLPIPLRHVLEASVLHGRSSAELAASLQVTPSELAGLRRRALRWLSSRPTPPPAGSLAPVKHRRRDPRAAAFGSG